MNLDTLPPRPVRLFCVDNAKASKARAFGYLNAILYMAPHEFAGVGNLCPHASPACVAACLGLHSGQASMTRKGHKWDAGGVRMSRAIKARHFMLRRAEFMRALVFEITRLTNKAERLGLKLAVRLNGSSDIAYEGIRVTITAEDSAALQKIKPGYAFPPGVYANLFAAFPAIQFVDYTKNPHRMRRALPPNYHLTFSRSETNESQALEIARAGKNVAVVFDALPRTWHGVSVIDGDKHDLRFLDPPGAIVGLVPKGWKAKKDKGGFVVRGYVNHNDTSAAH